MKKILLSLMAVAMMISVSNAQTTKPTTPPAGNKPDVKPVGDTVYHLQPVELFKRVIIMQNLSLLIKRPDDFSVNQSKNIIKLADSLVNVDGTFYNKVHPPKVEPPRQ